MFPQLPKAGNARGDHLLGELGDFPANFGGFSPQRRPKTLSGTEQIRHQPVRRALYSLEKHRRTIRLKQTVLDYGYFLIRIHLHGDTYKLAPLLQVANE